MSDIGALFEGGFKPQELIDLAKAAADALPHLREVKDSFLHSTSTAKENDELQP
jgi:hypothetical protein